jgi:hypothetical protein
MSFDKYNNQIYFDNIFYNLPEDIQTKIIEEYIKTQIYVDELLQEFEKQLLSEKCQGLEWQVLEEVTGKIIENPSALHQMCTKKMGIDFKHYYDVHFVEKVNIMKHPSFNGKPLSSFCACLTMCKWVGKPTGSASLLSPTTPSLCNKQK